MSNELPTKVLIFGTFDLLHDGHRAFIAQAAPYGAELHVSLPADETVLRYKQHLPAQTYEERKTALLDTDAVTAVHQSDQTPGSWDILKIINPDTIVLGYDQDTLSSLLAEHTRARIVRAQAYQPHRLHTSLLN